MSKRSTESNNCRLHKNAEYYLKRSLVLSLNVHDFPSMHLRSEWCLRILFVPPSKHTSYRYKNQSHNAVQKNNFSLFWNLYNIQGCWYPWPDQEGNKLHRQKILMIIYPIYYHNWRNISTVYIYNKISIKRNILTIKKNTSGSRSG
jgi:hypothetical protein